MSRIRTATTIVAGLTGGVGSGKSSAERLCRLWRIPTADADRWAHEVLARSAVVRRRIAAFCRKRWGISVLDSSGALDRAALAARVFADAGALAFLERLIHPAVKRKAAAWIAAQRRARVPLAVLVVPLLFESGMDRQVDCVIALKAPVSVRCERLRTHRGWTVVQARARMRHQLDDATRARRANYVVDNAGSRRQCAAALRTVSDNLRLRARHEGG